MRSFCSTGRSVTPPAWHGSSLRRMRTGLFLPIFGELSDPRVTAGLAVEAEEAGFDGVFVWDHVQYRAPASHIADAWITLAAMAVATERVRIGPLVTPLPRRRPHVVARQASRDRPAVGRATRARRRHRPRLGPRAVGLRRGAGRPHAGRDARRGPRPGDGPVVGRRGAPRGHPLRGRPGDLPAHSGPAARGAAVGRRTLAQPKAAAAGRPATTATSRSTSMRPGSSRNWSASSGTARRVPSSRSSSKAGPGTIPRPGPPPVPPGGWSDSRRSTSTLPAYGTSLPAGPRPSGPRDH